MRKISIKQLWSSGRSLQPTNLPSCLPATHAPCPASPVVGLTPPPSVQKPRIIDQFAPTRPVKPYTDVFVERETTGGTKGRQWADSSERRRTATWCWTCSSAWTTTRIWARGVRGMIFHDSEDRASSARSTPSRTRRSARASRDDLPGVPRATAASAASATPTRSRCSYARTWARSPSPRSAPSTTPTQLVDAVLLRTAASQFMAMSSASVNTTELVAALINQKDRLRVGHQASPRTRSTARSRCSS